MQEMIESGLLIVVAVLSIILLLIGQRPSSGMTKKQKIMLGLPRYCCWRYKLWVPPFLISWAQPGAGYDWRYIW